MNSRISTSPIVIVANKELRDSLRNRWVLFMGSLFLLLSLSITFAGSAVRGEFVLPALTQLMSNLSTVSVFIIPLAAILLSYDSFIGEQESGTLLLLLTYPISRTQILIGKLIGHSVVMMITISCSFGLTAILLYFVSGKYDAIELLNAFVVFITSSYLLAAYFIVLGYIVSLSVTEKAKAVAGLLFLWFLFVLVYDLLFLAILVADFSFVGERVTHVLIALNPTDLYRAINVINLDDTNASVFFVNDVTLNKGVMYLVTAAWVGCLTAVSLKIFKYKH
ncbi:ABC transporter permease [Shewanella intestini]|uniref:ABC transporter permease subunit n=1 Tax=Shewanella intestini TaxID=2017544 RepID=A0ABS5I5X8_9GAMM|nr:MULTISPECIES: ABC transporter permease subunit [Shewanella]MBR9728785.1 ABC transporter permease subunit [Shewanella intestini]MRG36860.1 ABC transporter permease subunit [Shewanella sp. XMDDZSB0408]